jgi:5-methylcytosine-specific restriction endonuclease McrA
MSDDNPFVIDDSPCRELTPRDRELMRMQGDVDEAREADDLGRYRALLFDLLMALSDDADEALQRAVNSLRSYALTDADNPAASDIAWAHAEAARRLRQMLAFAEPPTRRPLTKETRMLVYRRDGYQCVECGEHEIHELSVDHVVAVSAGGDNEPLNLRTLCRRCNSAKGARL